MWYGWLCFLVFGWGATATAQTPYGNEWIRPAQTYLRLGTYETGWYRLNATEIQKQGINLSTIPARSLQLFRRGQEVGMLVQGEQDGRLDATDYLEFYGQRNDGWLDTLLYVSPDRMPHPYFSMYSDTAAYFLTWRTDGLPGKRIQEVAAAPEPLSPIAYHEEKVLQVLSKEYAPGTIYPPGAGPDDGYLQTPGDTGEGWTGYASLANQWAEGVSLQTKNARRELFDRASVELFFVGRSAGEHTVDVWIGTAAQRSRKLGEVHWNQYETEVFKAVLQADDIDAEGKITITYLLRGTEGKVSVSYLKWTYPQNLATTSIAGQKALFPVDQHPIQLDSAASIRFFDVSDPSLPRQLVPTTQQAVTTLFPAGSTQVLAVKTTQPVPLLRPATFARIDSTRINYLIITHPLVRQPVSGSTDPVRAYADYRASPAGGSFTPLILNADEVADRFNYGERGPAGTRRLLRWLHDSGDLRYMFIIGRGRSSQYVRSQPNAAREDMVSSMGWPDSDLALGMGLDPTAPLVPLVPIGRLNAYTSQNVWDYLQKVKEHEAAPASAPWRKNVLHLSGGRSAGELALFKSFVDTYAATIVPSGVAPDLHTLSKKTTEYVERFPIAPIINEGVALMTLFGHSSLNVTDIEIGEVSNDALGYRNKGRYPAVIANGCALGNFYFAGPPTSTDWILTPNRGAVLFLAHTHLGYTGALYRYTASIYDVLADPAFTSRAFGDIMRESIRRRTIDQNIGLSDLVTAQQMNLQGDPALQIFPATRPDYTWIPASVQITTSQGGNVTAASDSLKLRASIGNYGRFYGDTYTIHIRRRRENVVLADYTFTRAAFPLRDSLDFIVPNDSHQGGNEVWEFVLDPENRISEENETNNIFSLALQLPDPGAIPLLPSDQSVFTSPEVELIAQIPASRMGQNVVFEWGTDPTFAQSTKSDTVMSTRILVRKAIVVPTDQQTIYWRVRVAGDSASPARTFRYDRAGPASTLRLPEGVASIAGTYPAKVEEGEDFSASVSFENITASSFRDSIQVRVREYAGSKASEYSFKIPPLAARETYTFHYEQSTLAQPGVHRTVVRFNTGQVPEYLLTNNEVELVYEVLPDRVAPVLEVLVDSRRITDGEAVSPEPRVQVRVLDSNTNLVRTDTAGMRVQLWKLCSQCPETPIQPTAVSWSPDPDFRADFEFSTLPAGTYRLHVEGRDAAGNAAAPYSIRFVVAESNRVVSATASPNPADYWVKFGLDLEGRAAPGTWEIEVFELSGKRVATFQNQPNLGRNAFYWVPAGIAGGTYFYRMKVQGEGWPEVVGEGKLLIVR